MYAHDSIQLLKNSGIDFEVCGGGEGCRDGGWCVDVMLQEIALVFCFREKCLREKAERGGEGGRDVK